MLRIIENNVNNEWNQIVKSFEKCDVYYLYEYSYALMLHGDGKPKLIYYEDDRFRMAYVMMENDISEAEQFNGLIQKGMFFDWTTPYGYGGPVFDGELSEDTIEIMYCELLEYCKKKNIISQFFRYNPITQNHQVFEKISENVLLKETIVVKTGTMEFLMKEMKAECRNRIRKAEHCDVKIVNDFGENMNEFIKIYEETMKFHNASNYYYFGREYFDYLIKKFSKNIVVFYGMYKSKIISAAIFLFNDENMHYHLGGTIPEYRKYAPFNLLLIKVAEWAYNHGIKRLHLGGGIERGDELYRFKKGFSPSGELDFYIGRTIFLPKLFDKMIDIRKENDKFFNKEQKYLILYRA